MCVGVCQSVQQREKQREEKTGRREDNRRRGGVSDQAGGGKWSPKAPRGSKVRWYQHATNAIKATSVPFATTSPHTHLPGQQKKPGWGGERSKAGAGQGAKENKRKRKQRKKQSTRGQAEECERACMWKCTQRSPEKPRRLLSVKRKKISDWLTCRKFDHGHWQT